MADRIITGIELGDRQLRIVVARHRSDSVRVIAHLETPSAGVENGRITDARALAVTMVAVSRSLRAVVDYALESVVFIVQPNALLTHQGEANLAPSGARQTVTRHDCERAVDEARPTNMGEDRQLLQTLPSGYILAGRSEHTLPIGKSGDRLTAFTNSISCESATVQGITEAARLSECENVAILAGPIAGCYGALTDGERRHGTALLAVGDRMSTITLMQDERLLGSKSISIGAQHFINDIAVALKLPYPAAEDAFHQLGTFSTIAGPPEANIVNSAGKTMAIDRVAMGSTLRDRATEFFTLTRNALEAVTGGTMMPAGVAFAGEPIFKDGHSALARSILQSPVHLASPRGLEGIPLAIARDSEWAVPIGSHVWAGTPRAVAENPWLGEERSSSSGGLGPLNFLTRPFSGRGKKRDGIGSER